MLSNLNLKLVLALIASITFFIPIQAHAEVTNAGIFNDIITLYKTQSATWRTSFSLYATWLYWVLVTISMVWTFGMLALKKSDISEFFSELVRFIIFVGFFWWLLLNGPEMGENIIQSLAMIGGDASGLGTAINPSGIVDIGFEIVVKVAKETSIVEPIAGALNRLVALIILIVLALISVNMLLVMISAWIIAYAGIFFLGFGGSKWTSDMAINYFKSVLSVGVEIMAMILLVGIGNQFIQGVVDDLSAEIKYYELAVVLVSSLILLALTLKIPSQLAGMVNGNIGSHIFGVKKWHTHTTIIRRSEQLMMWKLFILHIVALLVVCQKLNMKWVMGLGQNKDRAG